MIELGRQFGLYVIKEVITESGDYACCKAEDPFFNRDVLLKIFSIDTAETEKFGQLEELLEKLALLDHPSIAPIFDSGIEGDCCYYTTGSYFGGSLIDQLDGPLDAEPVLKIAVELTQALQYAQEKHVSHGRLKPEKLFFDAEGRVVVTDFGVDNGIKQLQRAHKTTETGDDVAETLHSLGELLLRLLLGPNVDFSERIDDLVAQINDARLKKLVGRLLLPGEWRFSSYVDLLEELVPSTETAASLSGRASKKAQNEAPVTNSGSGVELADDRQTEQAVAEIRRLVAEKNNLQQVLDKAIYERNLAQGKLSEESRQLQTAKQEVAKVQEEANVAWELVAGQRFERWRPYTWAVGGFVIGFLLSGGYGYYYSEQTRNELLAKLHENETLIKSAAWRTANQPGEPSAASPAAAEKSASVSDGDSGQADLAVRELEPVKEVAKQWWPAGNEFSPAAAIPVDQIKAAFGIGSLSAQSNLPQMLRQEVVDAVKSWASSWANQDVEGYLSHYSSEYRPELGRSQQQWREIRRERVTRPQWIQLELDDISMRKMDEGWIQVKLKQSYRSDFYQDRILKSLNLIKENGEWRILMERSLGMIDDTATVAQS